MLSLLLVHCVCCSIFENNFFYFTDGFEHILDESAAGSGEVIFLSFHYVSILILTFQQGGWKLHIFLSRILSILHRFAGCVVLLCNIENPNHVTLQRFEVSLIFCPVVVDSSVTVVQ